MLIQNISNSTQAPQPVQITDHGLAGNGAPAVVAPKTGAAAAEQQAAQPKDSPPTAAQVKNAVDSINKAMLQNNAGVEFSIDKDTEQTVIKVVESKTGDVIKQFPSEDILAIAHAIDQLQQRGLLLRQKA